MTIKIHRGILGELSPLIYFTGRSSDGTSSSNGAIEIDQFTISYNSEDPEAIDIIDNRLTITNEATTYDVYNVHYSEWVDSDEFTFGDADAVVEYILAEIASVTSNITGDNSLPQPRIGGQNNILVSANSPFIYDATFNKGIGYYWDESTFPAGVEVSRYDRRKIGGTISQVGTYVINLEIANKTGIVLTNVTIEVL
tara:strand:+ start:3631 stop:4221 length:591 start_codon:yes stop_codon:yes gene_type:complete